MSTVATAASFLDAYSDMRRAIFRTAWRIFAPLELGPTQVKLMRELSRNGPVAQATLARAASLDPAATSRAVQSLVDNGWVRRTPSEHDRRALRVETTESGKRAMKRIDAAYDALERTVAAVLTSRDQEDFRRIVKRVCSAEVTAEATPPAKRKRSDRSR